MNDNQKTVAELNKAIDNMAPEKEQKDRMWAHIEAHLNKEEGHSDLQKKHGAASRKVALRRLTAIAAALVLAITGVAIYNWAIGGEDGSVDVPAASGYVYAAEKRVTDMTPHEILVLTADPASSDETDVYAPAIYYLDSNRLIFGNDYGLVIYDRTNAKVEGLIDLQAICSSYYNCDTVKTHVTVNGSELVVYNTKGDYTNYGMPDEESGRDTTESAWGYYHIYDLNDLPGETGFIKCSESGKFETTHCDMYKAGKKFEEKHYLYAWENVKYLQTPEMDEAIGSDNGSYSEKAFVYTDSEGTEKRCVLLYMGVKDDAYTLLEEDVETGKAETDRLDAGITDEIRNEVKELCSLPAYEYAGGDPVMKAICEDIAANEEKNEGEVLIPELDIYGKVEEGGELLVFGDFFRDSYVKRGNTMVCVSGGSYPGCYHLKKAGDGDGSYKVVSFDMVEDGEGYVDSIKRMTEGHPVIRAKFMESAGFDEKVRRDCIKSYVEASGAGIEYYKDYGWDPIEL